MATRGSVLEDYTPDETRLPGEYADDPDTGQEPGWEGTPYTRGSEPQMPGEYADTQPQVLSLKDAKKQAAKLKPRKAASVAPSSTAAGIHPSQIKLPKGREGYTQDVSVTHQPAVAGIDPSKIKLPKGMEGYTEDVSPTSGLIPNPLYDQTVRADRLAQYLREDKAPSQAPAPAQAGTAGPYKTFNWSDPSTWLSSTRPSEAPLGQPGSGRAVLGSLNSMRQRAESFANTFGLNRAQFLDVMQRLRTDPAKTLADMAPIAVAYREGTRDVGELRKAAQALFSGNLPAAATHARTAVPFLGPEINRMAGESIEAAKALKPEKGLPYSANLAEAVPHAVSAIPFIGAAKDAAMEAAYKAGMDMRKSYWENLRIAATDPTVQGTVAGAALQAVPGFEALSGAFASKLPIISPEGEVLPPTGAVSPAPAQPPGGATIEGDFEAIPPRELGPGQPTLTTGEQELDQALNDAAALHEKTDAEVRRDMEEVAPEDRQAILDAIHQRGLEAYQRGDRKAAIYELRHEHAMRQIMQQEAAAPGAASAATTAALQEVPATLRGAVQEVVTTMSPEEMLAELGERPDGPSRRDGPVKLARRVVAQRLNQDVPRGTPAPELRPEEANQRGSRPVATAEAPQAPPSFATPETPAPLVQVSPETPAPEAAEPAEPSPENRFTAEQPLDTSTGTGGHVAGVAGALGKRRGRKTKQAKQEEAGQGALPFAAATPAATGTQQEWQQTPEGAFVPATPVAPALAPAPSAPSPVAEATTPPVLKALHEMSPQELDGALAEAQAREKNDVVNLFGPAGAKKYERLQRIAHSSIDHAKADKAQAEIEKMEATLTEEQRDLLFGIGDTRPALEEIKAMRDAVNAVDTSRTPAELATNLKYALGRYNDPSIPPEKLNWDQRIGYAELRHGFKVAQAHGWDANAVIKDAIKQAAVRYADPNDAIFMLEKLARAVGAPSEPVRETLPPPAAATEPPAAPAAGKAEDLQKVHTYEATVSQFAGDPKPKTVRIDAENRRHAEAMLAEKYPGTVISSAGRVETGTPEPTKEASAAAAPEPKPAPPVPPPAPAAAAPGAHLGPVVLTKVKGAPVTTYEVQGADITIAKMGGGWDITVGSNRPVWVKSLDKAIETVHEHLAEESHRAAIKAATGQLADVAQLADIKETDVLGTSVITANDYAMVLLDVLAKHPAFSNGVIFAPDKVIELAAKLRRLAKAIPENSAGLTRIAEALETHQTEHGFAIVHRSALHEKAGTRVALEEIFHRFQHLHGIVNNAMSRAINIAMNMGKSGEAWRKVQLYLERNYKYKPAHLPIEIPAWVASAHDEMLSEFGITPEQAANLLADYAKEVENLINKPGTPHKSVTLPTMAKGLGEKVHNERIKRGDIGGDSTDVSGGGEGRVDNLRPEGQTLASRKSAVGAEGEGAAPTPGVAEESMTNIVHYSNSPDIEELDPTRWGENPIHDVTGLRVNRPDEARKTGFPQYWRPETFVGDESAPEFRDKAAERHAVRQYTYRGQIPTREIYDMVNDPRGLREQSRQELIAQKKAEYGVNMLPSEPEVDAYTIHKLKEHGYTARRDINGLIASWEKIPVRRTSIAPEVDTLPEHLRKPFKTFVSPNVFNLNDIGEARGRVNSISHRLMQQESGWLLKEFGTKVFPRTAIGIWKDGAENSLVHEWPVHADPDLARYHNAVMSKAGYQKAFYNFIHDRDGKDVMYRFAVPKSVGDVTKLNDMLGQHGLDASTIMKERDGLAVLIGASEEDKADTLGKIGMAISVLGGKDAGIELRRYSGRSEFVGHDDRDRAQEVFARFIAEREAVHPAWGEVRVRLESRPDFRELQRIVRSTEGQASFAEVNAGGRTYNVPTENVYDLRADPRGFREQVPENVQRRGRTEPYLKNLIREKGYNAYVDPVSGETVVVNQPKAGEIKAATPDENLSLLSRKPQGAGDYSLGRSDEDERRGLGKIGDLQSLKAEAERLRPTIAKHFEGDNFAERRAAIVGAGNAYDPDSLLTGDEIAKGMTYDNSYRDYPSQEEYDRLVTGNAPTEEILRTAPRRLKSADTLQSRKPIAKGDREPAPVWYLKSNRVIADKMKGPMAGSDVLRMLQNNGITADELKWTGLDDYLPSAGRVTPEALKDFISQNAIQVKEIKKGKFRENQERLEALDVKLAREGKLPWDERAEYDRLIDEEAFPSRAGPKFSGHQEPGGENYRELLLTMPEKRPDTSPSPEAKARMDRIRATLAAMNKDEDPVVYMALVHERNRLVEEQKRKEAAADRGGFTSPHWDEPNVLAHVRMNDRTTPDGKKLLHVEEVQSDWHQKGRKGRYVDPQKPWGMTGSFEHFANEELARQHAAQRGLAQTFVRDERTNERPEGAVPDAPFKKNWQEMTLRRMIRYAAENGYDGISWTGGEKQAERYDLSKQISKVNYTPSDFGERGLLEAYDHSGKRVISEHIEQNELPDHIGKEAAEKLVPKIEEWRHDASAGMTPRFDEKAGEWYVVDGNDDPVVDSHEGPVRGNEDDVADYIKWKNAEARRQAPAPELRGLDLKVGGEGMKGFYDKIVPDYLNKFGKKFRARVGTVEAEIPHDRMRDPARYEGPEATIEELRDIGSDWNTPAAINAQARSVKRAMLAGQSFRDAMGTDGSDALAKRLGGRMVEPPPTMQPFQYLPITDAMHDSAMEEGMSLFSKKPKAAGATDLEIAKAEAERLKPEGAGAPVKTETPEFREARNKAFDAVADDQRGDAEDAMLETQHYAGGGVWPDALEHVGDLLHRMTEKTSLRAEHHGGEGDSHFGHGNVKDKVDRKLWQLKRDASYIPFEQEFRDNLHSNYEYRRTHGQIPPGTSFEDFRQHVYDLGEKYAQEHEKLPVYNHVQELARQAAVDLGRRDFKGAEKALTELKGYLDKGEEHWRKEAGQYDPNYEDRALQSRKAKPAAEPERLKRELNSFDPNSELGEGNAAALVAPDGKVAVGDYHTKIAKDVGYGKYKGSAWEEPFLKDGGVRVRARSGEINIEFGKNDPATFQRVRDTIGALPGNDFVVDYTPHGAGGKRFWMGDRGSTLDKLDQWETAKDRPAPAYGTAAYWREQGDFALQSRKKKAELGELQEQAERQRPRGSTVPITTATLQPRYKDMWRIGDHLESYTRQTLKQLKPGDTPAEHRAMVDRAVRLARDELKYQLGQENSGVDWYKEDVKVLLSEMEKLHPELKDPVQKRMFLAFTAATSPGKTAAFENANIAEQVYDLYKYKKVIPLQQPDGTPWGTYGNAPLQTLGALLKHFDGDEEKAMEWMMTKHPIEELEAIKAKVPKAKGKGFVNPDTVQDALPPDYDPKAVYGSYILGQKVGPFNLNLNGISTELTVDIWFMRTWNRLMGTLVGPNPKYGKKPRQPQFIVLDKPRGKNERAAMIAAIGKLQEEFGLETSQVQAALWYYEQGLYNRLGKKGTYGGTYADAAKDVHYLRSHGFTSLSEADAYRRYHALHGEAGGGAGPHPGGVRPEDTEGEGAGPTGDLFGDTSFDFGDLAVQSRKPRGTVARMAALKAEAEARNPSLQGVR